ncbi:MAG: ABC transporter substrate-binding protein [Caldilineaceae bacterium]|nr:ABC transporter substrate-binding protein [Caldilineaceae bacterium]MDE0183555.1 ABC transporter substrate-binding protein [Caldilineaceae bacterium]
MRPTRFSLLAILLIVALIFAACGPSGQPDAAEEPAAPAQEEQAAAEEEEEQEEAVAEEEKAEEEAPAMMSERTGAWVDEVIAVEEPTAAAAVTRMDIGELDAYAFSVSDAEVFATVQGMDSLTYSNSFGVYAELTFNPAGPVFSATEKLNPFAVPRIREAMNYLVDRDFISQEIYGGLASPRYMAITNAFPDYARLVDIVRKLELKYAHNPDRAAEIITEEMEALGAEMVDGLWHYEDEPVEVIFLIRTEDERKEIGDYVSTMLEDLGFTVIRDYKTAAEASPIWIGGDPNDGQFHIYTGGWITTAISRDQAGNFDFFYTSRGLSFPLWQAYSPAEEFDAVSERLALRDFTTMDERKELFGDVLELSMQDSVRVWLVNQLGFTAYRSDVAVTTDLAGGLNGARLWPYTLRRVGEEGGSLNVAMPSILTEPWNPVAGTNWIYDTMLIRATNDLGLMPDPFTGLQWPQRVERAEVTIAEGLPVGVTHDWVDLTFADHIHVPDEAWIDWDAVEQRWIPVSEFHPDGLTANVRSVVYYPADLYDLTWHDGSNLSIGDVVYSMILGFDRAKEESAIFDEAEVPQFQRFQTHFKGYRIVQENPLIVEYYSDQYLLDAELNVNTFFPGAPWSTVTVGALAEAAGELAYSKDKSVSAEVEWTSFIAGPSLEILAAHLDEADASGHIPYEATLGDYISADEAASRWENLGAWYENKGHFWVGLGPFYLEEAFTTEKTVQLLRYDAYPDLSTKWQAFEAPMIAEVELDGPARVASGDEATFDVLIEFGGDAYATANISEVKYLVFDALGELALTGAAEPAQDGLWQITLSAEDTAGLESGANKLEVAVVPLLVSIPTFSSVEFVTTN